jgi:UPF0716 family protein affecting phage T7 exclusion
MWRELQRWEQGVLALGALLMVAPGLISTLIGAVVAAPVLLRQWASRARDGGVEPSRA